MAILIEVIDDDGRREMMGESYYGRETEWIRYQRLTTVVSAAWTDNTEEAVLVRAAQEQYVQKTLARWRSAGLDLLVLPGFACPPPPREKICELIGTSRPSRPTLAFSYLSS